MKTQSYFRSLVLLIFSFLLMTGCTKDLPDPPVIKSYVNDTETETLTVEAGTIINYKFEIQAFDKIADIKLVIFDVLKFEEPMVKTGVQTLVGGLTNSLKETVAGVFIVRQDSELMLIVKDNSGNEVNKSIIIKTE